MKEFNSTFKPLLAYYEGTKHFRRVDGQGLPDDVFESVIHLFKESA
jgi:adenylate kinase family enzyme